MKFNSAAALVLIDIQKGFDNLDYWGGERNNPDAEQKASEILSIWRSRKWPLYHVKHCSTNPKSLLREGQNGNEFNELVQPLDDELVIKKNVNSAFIGTDLKNLLTQNGISIVVLVGLTTDHCVSTTARMAGNFGFETYIVSDATATFNKVSLTGENFSAVLIHNTALASLHGEFATVLTLTELKKLID